MQFSAVNNRNNKMRNQNIAAEMFENLVFFLRYFTTIFGNFSVVGLMEHNIPADSAADWPLCHYHSTRAPESY